MEMRQARPEDAPAIQALTRLAYGKWVPVIGREPKPMTADYDLAVAQHRFDLLFRQGVLVGLLETIPQPDHLLVENIAIHPDHQRQGLGCRLLAHAEALARAAGQAEVRLYTNGLFTGNVALYRSAGYRIDSEAPVSGGVLVNLSKRLAP